MSTHPQGKSCSDLSRVLVLNDPPAGFAFIEFDDSRDAEDAVRGRDGQGLTLVDFSAQPEPFCH